MQKERRERSGAPARTSRAKRLLFRRTVILMVTCGVVLFVPLFWKLWDIAIVHHEEYQRSAVDQQTLDLTVEAGRGNIYDRNGNVMAMSATVQTLVLSPRDLIADLAPKKEFLDDDGNLKQAEWEAEVAAVQNQMIQDLMALIPDLDLEKVAKQVRKTNSAYERIKLRMEQEEAAPIQEFITENKTSHYLYMEPGSKRYYPYASLAAQALGFTNDNGGVVGIESAYDDVLQGTAGRVLTTRTARGTQMYNGYSRFIDAVEGYDLTLTLDTTIQAYAEKALEEGIKDYDVRNGGFCLVMSPKTGAILAMASSPDFDPNNYSTILDDLLNQNLEGQSQTIYEMLKAKNTDHSKTNEDLWREALSQAKSDARNTQWRSKALDSRYEPGSTFKAVVLAAALEEGLVSESDTFMCTGSYKVAGYPRAIGCSKRQGHGLQTLAEAVQNSCNPAFMQIGQRLGVDTFYDYFEAFGMTQQTGIDLPGEASLTGAYWAREKMTGVDLAVASFGQRFEVTPLQMISAFSAVINGGHLVRPYLVQSVSTGDGTVIQSAEPVAVRQVVSAETSRRATAILESVVAEGTGGNAYQPGYRIGGKTGSSETGEEGRTIVSFMGFAPAEDPEIIVLLAYDKPQESSPGAKYGTTGVYISGGNMAAPKAGVLIAQILDYLGVEKQYTEEESAAVDVQTPTLAGQTMDNAIKRLKDTNLSYRTVGEGDVVTHQIPAPRANVPGGSTVILYLGDAAPEESTTVPDVTGLSYEAARKKLESAGLFMKAAGVSTYYANTTTVESQTIPSGETVPMGTVVEVRFINVVEDGWVDIE